jgi:hypothetical protein
MKIKTIVLFGFIMLSSCKFDLFDSEFEEVGKINGNLTLEETGQPIPGVIVVSATYAGGGGMFSLSPNKTDYQYSYTDENGNFQIPKMKLGGSYNDFSFQLDTANFKKYIITTSGNLNGGKQLTNEYLAIKGTILKLKLIFDTSTYYINLNNYAQSLSINNFNSNLYLFNLEYHSKNYEIFNWFPKLQKEIPIDYYNKKTRESGSTIIEPKNMDFSRHKDTCYADAFF